MYHSYGLVFKSRQAALALDEEIPRADEGPAPYPSSSLRLTVLVNEHTASAAEILAGALKDNCRAVLVGEKAIGL